MTFNLATLFETVADAVAERDALVCGPRRWTYAQLDERANRFAHHLMAAGVRPGEHVGLYAYNGVEYVEAMIGCLKARAVPINVNYRYVEGELSYLVRDADLVAMVHQREFAPRLAAVREGTLLRHFIAVDDDSGADLAALGAVEYESALAECPGDRDFPERSGDDHYIIYTGGTTGMPKGVVWRQEDIFFTGMGGGNPMGEPVSSPAHLAENAKARYQLVQFPVPPLIHGAAQLGVFIGLNWGDKVVLIPRFDPEAVWDACEAERVNTITIVGDAMARPMAEALETPSRERDLSSVVYIGSAGAVLSEAVKAQLRAHLPNTIVTENFGATETGHQGMAAPDGQRMKFLMNDRTAVFDDDLKRIEPGSEATGRLAQTGRIPQGYYKDPVKTAATFVEAEGKRWVMPGDYAKVLDDGTILVLGRGSACINSGGEKIYPEEVEAAIKAHADVYDVVVVGVPDERWGERVTALIQPRAGAAPTLADIDGHCRTLIAGYKVPREIHLVDALQRQPSGKPDYPWAREQAARLSASAAT